MSDPRTTEEKIASFRLKYPDRVAKLTATVAPLLGIHARTKLSPEAVEAMCRPITDKMIAVVWGLNDA